MMDADVKIYGMSSQYSWILSASFAAPSYHGQLAMKVKWPARLLIFAACCLGMLGHRHPGPPKATRTSWPGRGVKRCDEL